jgi:hypothetical protein
MDVMMDGWMDVCGNGNVLNLTILLLLLLLFTAISHALGCKPQPNIGSPDPFIFSFPLKLIGADHGLHTSGGVQFFCDVRD